MMSPVAKDNPLFAYLNPSLVQDEKGNYFPAKGPVSGYALIKEHKAKSYGQ